jgi:hypothetical protein
MTTKSRIGQNILPDRQENVNNFTGRIIRNNLFTRPVDQGLAAYGQQSSQSLGVEQELRRFAMNEYLKTRNDQVLVGTTNDAIEEDVDLTEDDLLLTNAITENTVQDTIDKTRYLKETVSYVTVNSAARTTALDVNDRVIKGYPTLTSTGDIYVNQANLAPFAVLGPSEDYNRMVRNRNINIVSSDGSQNMSLGPSNDYTANQPPTDVITNPIPFNIGFEATPHKVIVNTNNNRVTFKLKDLTNVADQQQIPTGPPNGETSTTNTLFDFFIPVGSYTVTQLQSVIQNALDLQIPNVFTVHASTSRTMNPGYVNLNITVPPQTDIQNYVFIMDFNVPLNQPTIAAPAVRADGAFVTPLSAPDGQTLSSVATSGSITFFPNPNNYIITLNRAMTNVKAIRLVSSEIPNTDTIINNDNNFFNFKLNKNDVPVTASDGTTGFQIIIAPGNYTVEELAAEIELQLNNVTMGAGEPNVFQVTVDKKKGIFKISTHSPYTFFFDFIGNTKFAWRNVYQMLGFQYPSTSGQSMNGDVFVTEFSNLVQVNQGTAQMPVLSLIPFGAFNLKKSNIVWLNLNGYETIYDTYTQSDYFAKFTFNNVPNNDIAYDTFNSSPMVFIDAPIPSISQLTVSFFDELGTPYNFNNVDQSFTLEFRHHLDRVQGVDYSSRRGTNDKTSYV